MALRYRVGAVFFLAVVIIWKFDVQASIDAKTIIFNIEQNDKQQVLTGHIDSLLIKRGNAEFQLGPGQLTLFNFGSGRISAMVFEGQGNFKYMPPDLVEMGQVKKFTGRDTIDEAITRASFFFSVELDQMPDTNQFTSSVVNESVWKQLKDARDEEFDHLALNVTSKFIGDLIADGPGTFFNAVVSLASSESYAFVDDPFDDDLYCLYDLIKHAGSATADIISSFSSENDLPSQRGVIPIDITHYEIDSRIEGGGKMIVKCRINFTPLRWGRQYVYFPWYYKNKLLSAFDSRGDSLLIVHRNDKSGVFTAKIDEPGFGLVLNKPLELGQNDSIDISFECNALENRWGVFYISLTGQSFWYPQNAVLDKASFDMTFNCPKNYEVVASGNNVETRIEGDRSISKWHEPTPICYASFNIGVFENQNFFSEAHTPVKVYLSENIPHDEIALYLASIGELSSGNMMNRVGADVSNSLAFYTSLFGPCPFDTIKVVEIPEFFGLGTAGLVHLAWTTFQMEKRGGDPMFRAHEVAHQWWPHVVSTESYRDAWLMEGLAEYCGYWFYQASSRNTQGCKDILKYWREYIAGGQGVNSEGNKAGPIILGSRLSSSKSSDYSTVVYYKGAYVFHMIRYLMHDYKTGSDDAFGAFLKDMAVKFKNKVLTTPQFQALLEKHIGGDMSWFFKQWVSSTDIPEYKFSYKTTQTEDSKYEVTCHITQDKVAEDFQMVVPLTVFFKDDKFVHLKVLVDKPEIDIDLPILPYKPEKIIFNTYDAVLAKVRYE
jgi:hypothetical protein